MECVAVPWPASPQASAPPAFGVPEILTSDPAGRFEELPFASVFSPPVDPSPNRRKTLLLGAAAVAAPVLGLVFVLLFLKPGPDADQPPDRDAPEPLPAAAPADAEIAAALARVRESGGTDEEALARLGASLPGDPAAAAALIERIRPELDLAILSPSPGAGAAAVRVVARAIRAGGEPVRLVVESAAYGALVGRGLASPAPEVRAATVALLADVGTDAARARIVPLLDDEAPSVRAAAVRAYGTLATAAGARRLGAILDAEPDEAVRTEVLRAFTRNPALRGPEVVAAVRRALADGAPGEKLQALSYVTLRRDRTLVPDVLPLLADPARDVRAQAVRTLTLLRDARAREALEEMLAREEDDEVKRLAEEALAGLR